MAYDIKMVKQLRDATQAGFADCKKAVEETNGDYDKAIDWLKKRGIAKASKKAGAIAAEGSIHIINKDSKATIIELNSQTDFVAISDNFKAACEKITSLIYKAGDKVKELKDALAIKFDGKTIDEYTTELTGTIGEKISLRRFENIVADKNQSISTYLHANGKIGVVILLDKPKLDNLAKDIAMHSAAMRPQYISMKDVPTNVVEKEKEIILEQMQADPSNSSKPKDILKKMADGKVKKSLRDIVIEEQPFVKDSKKTVSQTLKDNSTSIVKMIRFEVGEGIEVSKTNFEEEVKKQIS